MPAPPLKPPLLIQRRDQLRQTVDKLCQQDCVAVDTESNSLYAYSEQVCLIQLSIPKVDYLVDPLAAFDPKPLHPFLANPTIEKVFHGAEYDLACLKREFGFRIVNLFDTRVAIRTLGREPTGLADILATEFGVRMNKRYQRADWGKRPLPAEYLDYARLDTHYLLPLRDTLESDLKNAGRLEEALELCEYLTFLEPSDTSFDPDGFWRINQARTLKPQQAAVLRELYLFRDETARLRDRPPFKIMGDTTLMAITKALPGNLQELERSQGMTKGQLRRYGRQVLSAVATGLRSPAPRPPRPRRPNEATLSRYDQLRTWRKKTARKRQVESDLILPREVVWEIARTNPTEPQALRSLMKPLEWRFQTYGGDILQLLSQGE